MKILVVDVGGSHVKVLASGQGEHRSFDSGPEMTARAMVDGVLEAAEGWDFEAVSLGYPGPALRGRPLAEPKNLGAGWVGFDYEAAFGRPLKLVNDAAMQAVGAYRGGRLLFLGLGTGLGSAMIVEGLVEPMELAHLPYRKATYEHYVGERGLERLGKKRWRRQVDRVVEDLAHALLPTDIVIGGGNARKLKEPPAGARIGDNADAFAGGFTLWLGNEWIQAETLPTHAAGRVAAPTPQASPEPGPSPQADPEPDPEPDPKPAAPDDHAEGESGATAADDD